MPVLRFTAGVCLYLISFDCLQPTILATDYMNLKTYWMCLLAGFQIMWLSYPCVKKTQIRSPLQQTQLFKLSLIAPFVVMLPCKCLFNTLRPRQNCHHFPDDRFKWIFLNENVRISIKMSLNFVHKCPINNIPALVQIMAWCRPGDNPLSESMTIRLPTHICVTRPEWIKQCWNLHLLFLYSVSLLRIAS